MKKTATAGEPMRTVAGQPSWRLATPDTELYVTKTGGHLGPVTFDRKARRNRPLSIAPWAEEPADPALPPVLRVLRGDFFCLPFGGNTRPYRGEQHPVHGETANADWSLEERAVRRSHAELLLSLDLTVRPGRVEKLIRLVPGHSAVYCRHTVTGMTGKISFGHHAMLRFPKERSAGLVSTSPFRYGQIFPEPVERPENRGYSILKPGAEITSLDAVPTLTGELLDLSRFPTPTGYEDLFMIASDETLPFAWSAVVFPAEGYLWFQLKNPRVLRQTVFWVSNGGRHYPPWNGRHTGILALEEVTSYFHPGLAESAAPNPWSRRGYSTTLPVSPKTPLEVNVIYGVAPVPKAFAHVVSIEQEGEDLLRIIDRNGRFVSANVDLGFLNLEET